MPIPIPVFTLKIQNYYFTMIENIYTVRHGSRLDFEDDNWKINAVRPDDPPLSEKGMKQAVKTAEFLKNRGIRHIFSSPFYRTLQTAGVIASALNLRINVEDGLSEWLNPLWFDDYPVILSQQEREKEFDMIEKDYNSVVYPVFPEREENVDVFIRIKQVLNKLIYSMLNTVLIVGHGATVSQIGRVLLDFPAFLDFGYCAVNHLKYENNKWNLKMGTSKHLVNV